MNVSEVKVFQYVAEGLYLIGYPKDIEIHSYVGDGDRPMYYATYEKDYKGTMTKHIKRLSISNVVDLMKFDLEVNGYDIQGIFCFGRWTVGYDGVSNRYFHKSS